MCKFFITLLFFSLSPLLSFAEEGAIEGCLDRSSSVMDSPDSADDFPDITELELLGLAFYHEHQAREVEEDLRDLKHLAEKWGAQSPDHRFIEVDIENLVLEFRRHERIVRDARWQLRLARQEAEDNEEEEWSFFRVRCSSCQAITHLSNAESGFFSFLRDLFEEDQTIADFSNSESGLFQSCSPTCRAIAYRELSTRLLEENEELRQESEEWVSRANRSTDARFNKEINIAAWKRRYNHPHREGIIEMLEYDRDRFWQSARESMNKAEELEQEARANEQRIADYAWEATQARREARAARETEEEGVVEEYSDSSHNSMDYLFSHCP